MKIELEGIYNLRDLGGLLTENGKHIRNGMLYRSSLLNTATPADIELLEKMNIKQIYDLRSEAEQIEKPDPVLRNATHISMAPLSDITAGITRDSKSESKIMKDIQALCITPNEAIHYMMRTYSAMVNDPSSLSCFSVFLHSVCEVTDGAVLWHCFSGKDRAGFATVLVLLVLGCDRETILSDYLYTNECSAGAIEQFLSTIPASLFTPNAELTIRNLLAAKSEYINVVFDAIDTKYGGADSFLHNYLGLKDSEIRQAREMYLE